ncbi:serine--tRNA ligase [bacterium]|nr:serine--tRNA ligase [bacterium]
MIDLKLLRDDPDTLRRGIQAKRVNVDLDRLIQLDESRRSLARRVDELNTERNAASKSIGQRIKAGENPETAKAEVRALGDKIAETEQELAKVEAELHGLALMVPNTPHASAPAGYGEEDNVEVARHGDKPAFDFAPKPHWELGEALDIIDITRGTKLSGSGFYCLKGLGARLERSLISWFIDVHTKQYGYTEVLTPYMVNSKTMTGTGQLPKMADDMYKVLAEEGGEDLWLIPTAEVPVTNLYQDEILDGARLPIYHCAFSPCFRREAGSYGKEVRGITRVHQFHKVEMVKFVKPETSYDELEALRGQAESLLKALGLHYRVLSLCAGDLSFAAAKCYDLEVWAPGMDRFLEVSSCSNFEDFQARRANIRFKADQKAKPQFIHTLNGSGLALPRCVIAIIENYQQSDGTIKVPDVLVPYMGCEVIAPR